MNNNNDLLILIIRVNKNNNDLLFLIIKIKKIMIYSIIVKNE